jgi:hybrid cluster-associated redox disulfide protein
MNAHAISLQPNTSISDLFERWPQMIPVFIHHRMLCVGCSMAAFDSLEDAARNYGLKLEDFILELKDTLPSPG